MEHESSNKAELDQKIEAFQYAILEAAKTNVEKKPVKSQTVTRSAELENLFTEWKKLKSEGKYDLAKKITWKIRKQIRKDRLDNTIKDLEDQLWHDIKKAKTAFVPSHTKLLNKEGVLCTSNERPDILADFFEHTQWAIDHDREKETPSTKLHPNLPPPPSYLGNSQ